MLANPHLSPFDVIERPGVRHDWMLIDHLITRFRVSPEDYVEDDIASIRNMARRLACLYAQEMGAAECLVLVRDGRGAQKPAVRSHRDRYPLAPHLDFCRRNADAIDYLMLKFLRDANAFPVVFIVDGQEWSSREVYGDPDCKCLVFDIAYNSYGIGASTKPLGYRGACVYTVAGAKQSGHVEFLGAACKKTSSTEADTLMVELANNLPGTALVCTSDSDAIAVLTACGREGLTLRLSNSSYANNRPMHDAVFGDMCATSAAAYSSMEDADFESSELRLQALYDVPCADNCGGDVEKRHVEWERIVLGRSERDLLAVTRYLYQGGIRGSVYGDFLDRVSRLSAELRSDVARILVSRAVSRGLKCVSRETFDLFPDRKDAAPPSPEEYNAKRPHEGLDANDSTIARDQKQLHANMHKLSKLYAEGKVPRCSHGRYLRLTAMSPNLYMRIKPHVLESQPLKRKHLMYMILFGTDYTRTFQGLGPKGLLKVGVSDTLGGWCEELEAAWHTNDPDTSLSLYRGLYNRLATLAKIPTKVRAGCSAQLASLTFRTMRYVYDMWRLQEPKPDGSYGFHVDENYIMTFVEPA